MGGRAVYISTTSAEPPGSFASGRYPCIPEKPVNIKTQRILSITGKKSITRGIVPMTNTPARSAQPSDKPAYVPPRVMRLGDLNEGAGACTAGSGVVVAVDCSSNGGSATGACLGHGMDADGASCTSQGVSATSGSCTGDGGGAITSCANGPTNGGGTCTAGSGP